MLVHLNRLILMAMLLISVIYDLKYRRIPNFITFPVFLWGIISAGIFSGFNGILFSMGGFLVGLAVFLIPFSMGGMGAGDVKLMAAVGSIVGWKLTIYSALLTAIAGGIIGIGYTIFRGYFTKMIKNIGISLYKVILYFVYLVIHNKKLLSKFESLKVENSNIERIYIPYGVSIAIGTLFVIMGNYFGYAPFI